MKSYIKSILTYTLFPFLILSCTKQTIIDSGISSPYHEGSIMEYLRNDDYNWKLTVEMIERGGLTDVFEGRVDSLKEITFLGPTSYSILRHLFEKKLDAVEQLSPEFCKETILKHLIKGKHLKDQIPFRDKQYYIFSPEQPTDRYLLLNTLGGIEIRAYLEQWGVDGIPDVGPKEMFLYSMTRGVNLPVASPDIQPRNGVVHSLNYDYILNNL